MEYITFKISSSLKAKLRLLSTLSIPSYTPASDSKAANFSEADLCFYERYPDYLIIKENPRFLAYYKEIKSSWSLSKNLKIVLSISFLLVELIRYFDYK